MNVETRSTPSPPLEHRHGGSALDAVKYWAITVALASGVLIAHQSHNILPSKIFLDESIIVRFISGELQSGGWSSYGTTGWLYRVTGLGSIPDIFPVLSYCMFAAIIIGAVGWRRIPHLSFPAIGLAAGALLLGAVYLSQYSKEFFVLPLAALLLLARRSRFFEILWIVLVLVYATFVREYWFLVLVFYLPLRLLIPRLRSSWLLIPIIMTGFAAAIIAFGVTFGSDLTFFRTDVNNTLDFDRSTQIDDVVSGSSFQAQLLNAGLTMLILAVPLKMLTSGSPDQLIAGAFMAVCWALVAFRAHRITGTRGPAVPLLAFLISFLMVQMAFEPDYGSYIRHITPQLALFLALLLATNRRQETS